MTPSFASHLANRGSTPIADMEDVVDEAATEGADMVTDMVNTIMPDGRPFGMEEQTKQEEAEFYVEHLRGNVLAWDAWRDSRRSMVMEKLQGVRPELMGELDLDKLINGYARIYSAEMEKVAAKYGLLPPPPIPFPQMPIPSPFSSPSTNMAPPIPFPSPTTNSVGPFFPAGDAASLPAPQPMGNVSGAGLV